jgi:hypothetical protein
VVSGSQCAGHGKIHGCNSITTRLRNQHVSLNKGLTEWC